MAVHRGCPALPRVRDGHDLAVHQSRALLAGVRLARSRAGRRPGPPPARAGEVRRDLHPEPRRVLPDQGLGSRGAGRCRRGGHDPRRHESRRSNWKRSANVSSRCRNAPTRSCSATCCPRSRRNASGWCTGSSSPTPTGTFLGTALPRAHLPRAHALVGRPVAPVPLHLQPVAEPRGGDPRSSDG